MYNLLVVDDEEIAVKGIVHGIDWSDMPFAKILYAYDVSEARDMMSKENIHLLLSDIDMPDMGGIGLLRWVREHSPHTETIFLTGHADFSYAKQALQLGSFDYLLKPIDHRELKTAIGKALEKIQTSEEAEKYRQTYEFYYEQWNRQLPELTERFWQDVINLRVPVTSTYLASAYSLYGIPLEPEDSVCLILISVEDWNEELSARDEEIMTYALKNAAEEVILKEDTGLAIREDGGTVFVIVYRSGDDDIDRLMLLCHSFVKQCKTYLRCELSCYVGDPVQSAALEQSARKLLTIERNYLSQGGAVIAERDYAPETAVIADHPGFESWGVLLEMGKTRELMARLEESLGQLAASTVDSLFLEGYYHGLVYTVYHTLQKKSVPMNEVYPDDEWRDGPTITKSLPKLADWARKFVGRAAECVQQRGKDQSPFVQKAIHFINDHISEDLSRERIAGHVYLNPAYLSRLFKKEAGLSLTDYIMDARVALARPLLEKTNLKISDIGLQVGYDNFSHFTKTFKKITGLAPVEYRRKFQQIDNH